MKMVDESGADVGLDEYARLVVCKHTHCRAGVRPDSRQWVFQRTPYVSLVSTDDFFRRIVQILPSPVVAEPAPDFENIGQRRLCERADSRKLFQELFILFDYARYLRLLQHHFGNENAVGVMSQTPRQIMPPVLLPILPHRRAEVFHAGRSSLSRNIAQQSRGWRRTGSSSRRSHSTSAKFRARNSCPHAS